MYFMISDVKVRTTCFNPSQPLLNYIHKANVTRYHTFFVKRTQTVKDSEFDHLEITESSNK